MLDLVGHCQSFDLTQLDEVPRKDLPDLIPFSHGMLVRNRRRPERDDGVFSFKTPDEWLSSPGIRTRCEGLIFHRNPRDNEEAKRIVGVGHQVFDRALAQAGEWVGAQALVKDLPSLLAVFRFQDSVTGQSGQVGQVIAGVTHRGAGEMIPLRDEDVLALLNQPRRGTLDSEMQTSPPLPSTLSSWLSNARTHALATSDTL